MNEWEGSSTWVISPLSPLWTEIMNRNWISSDMAALSSRLPHLLLLSSSAGLCNPWASPCLLPLTLRFLPLHQPLRFHLPPLPGSVTRSTIIIPPWKYRWGTEDSMLGILPDFCLCTFSSALHFYPLLSFIVKCFWIMASEKTLESPWDNKEIKPVNPKGNQPWICIGRTDAFELWCWRRQSWQSLG